MRRHTQQRLSVRGEEVLMDRDTAERWLRANDPERRPKSPPTLNLESPIEGAPARTIKIEQ